MNVVLVHGWLNRGSIMRSLARALQEHGHVCYSPSLRPCDGRGGLAALSLCLQRGIDECFGTEAPLVLVGFSMGALISRHYLQVRGGRVRAQALFSIAGPHRGTVSAYLYPSQGVRDMRPGSRFLSELDRTRNCLAGLPVVSYWTPFDAMIRPVGSAQWTQGEVVRVPAPFHALLPFDKRLQRDLCGRLSQVAPAPAAVPAGPSLKSSNQPLVL